MAVGIAGTGTAMAAVEAAVGDVTSDIETVAPEEIGGFDLAVVVGQAGDPALEQANEAALATDQRWLAVELGGVGGHPVVEAAVAGFSSETGCYGCLSGRVTANLDPQTEPVAAPPAHTARFAGALGGRLAARFLAEDATADCFGRVLELPHADRRFLPLPNCTCARERGEAVPLSAPDGSGPPIEESLGRAERGLDDRLGVVQEVGEAESFPVPYYLARSCDTTGFSDVTAPRDAAGVAAGWDAAFMKALGEAMERYCAGVYRLGDAEQTAPAQTDSAVSPSSFVTEESVDPNEQIHWVPATNLSTRDTVSVPASFVYYPPPTERYRPAVTTGLGLGNAGLEAVMTGLYEVLERDAAMLAWYSTFDPLGLNLSDHRYETLHTRATSENLTVTPVLVTQDIDVPVVAVAVHRDEWPRFALGSGAHLDPARAARSALAEALQNWTELRSMGPEAAEEAAGQIGRYADFPETVETFIDTDTAIDAGTLGPEELPTGTDALSALLDRLEATDCDAYAVRTTTRDVEALGFEAVRALVPSAQPLFFGSGYFGERAKSVPVDLGFEPRLDREHHPFP